MKKLFIAAALAAGIAAVALGGFAGAETTLETEDIGTGESLSIVVAGEFPTVSLATSQNQQFDFGELQGFYLAQTAWFEALLPGNWVLVSAFRTQQGAEEFVELATAAGATNIRVIRTRYLGTEYIGLGQEASLDGSGPMVKLPESR